MIRRRPSTPFSNRVTLQEQDSRNPRSVTANSSSSSSSKMLSVSPSRAAHVWEFIILSVSRVGSCDSNPVCLIYCTIVGVRKTTNSFFGLGLLGEERPVGSHFHDGCLIVQRAQPRL